MKILVIDYNKLPQKENSFGSGVSKVAREMSQVLSRLEHDVTLFSTSDSDLILGEGYEHVLSQYPSGYAASEMGITNRENSKGMLQDILQIKDNFDLVINHSERMNNLHKAALDWEIPYMVINHGNPIGGIPDLGIAVMFQKLIKAGHAVVAVSDFTRVRWNNLPYYFDGMLEIGTEVNNDFCILQYIDKLPEYSKSEGYGCVIGRADIYKRPHVGLAAMEYANVPGKAFLAYQAGMNKGEEYFSKHIAKGYKDVEVHLNRPYAQTMEALSKADFFISTWIEESSGITAMEAAMRGVPVILQRKYWTPGKKNPKGVTAPPYHHASEQLLPEGMFEVNDQRGIKAAKATAEVIKKMDWSIDRRMELRERTFEKLHISKYESNILNLIDRTIERFNGRK